MRACNDEAFYRKIYAKSLRLWKICGGGGGSVVWKLDRRPVALNIIVRPASERLFSLV